MFQKNIHYIFLIIAIFLISFVLYSVSIQKSISSKVLRLHILANSNSSFDQELKLKVRDNVINYITPLLKDSSSLSQSKEIISKNMEAINTIAQETVSKYSNYKTYISLASSNFPTKHYENFSFPAGNYEALKVIIGEGKGNNWWCVMFPPLCFTNSSSGEFDKNSEKQLKESLSDKEYELVNNYEKTDVKVKFKILEWLNK